MSGRASGGAAAKRQRLPLEEEGGAGPIAQETTARPKVPLPLLAVVMWLHGTLVWLQLCNPQGVALFSFVCLPPRVPHPFSGAPVYDISLTHAERLRAVGCGFKGKPVQLLSLGVDRHLEPQRNWGACRKMMQSNVRRVAAGLAAAVLERVVKEADVCWLRGNTQLLQCNCKHAINLGHLPSRAHLADLFLWNREGFVPDCKGKKRAFALAEEGAHLGTAKACLLASILKMTCSPFRWRAIVQQRAASTDSSR
jgi:hypothetical protein